MAPTSKAFVTVLLSLALCQITAAEPSLKDDLDQKIVVKLQQLTSLSNDLQQKTASITDTTATDKGNEISVGFSGIRSRVTEANSIISSAPRTSKFADGRATIVVNNLRTFVEGQQQLHKVLIGKLGIRQFAGFFGSIITSLRSLQNELNVLKTDLIVFFPSTQESIAEDHFDTLNRTIENTITALKQSSLTSHGDSPVEVIQEALTTFLQAQQALLNVLIGKHGITTYAGDLA